MADPVGPPGLPAPLAAVRVAAAPLTERFVSAGYQFALVGGIVRDHLRGEVIAPDLDATTDARPPAIKELVADLADAVWTQGERFGTIGCQIDGQPWEITTIRADAYDEESRKPVVSFGDRLEDDLARRDFTINAMAVDLDSGDLIDPYGGAVDLQARRLATPLDPEISFSDDPLRMLRAARFLARFDLTPDPGLVAAIGAMGDRMAIVSIERIYDELTKLLLLPAAGRGLRFLAETGLWVHVLPSVDWDSGMADRVESFAADAETRWAALLIDHDDPGGVMRSLRSSAAAERAVVALTGVARWSGRRDDVWVRRTAAAAPASTPIDEQVAFARGLGVPEVGELAESVTRLRGDEPDLDDPEAPLDGLEIAAILAVEPGPVVGRALAWLTELRMNLGPLSPEEARARLAEWSDPELAGSSD